MYTGSEVIIYDIVMFAILLETEINYLDVALKTLFFTSAH